MNICGVVVLVYPNNIDVVRARIKLLPGVDVHAVSPEGKMVVTIENDIQTLMADTLIKMQNIEDVLSAVMIYNHFEDTLAFDQNTMRKEHIS